MYSLLLLLVLALTFSSIIQLECQLEPFKPVTENVSFKALFRLQLIADRELVYMSETYEQYHHQLEASNIWQVKVTNGDGRKTTKRFVYNSQTRIDLELDGHADEGPGELFLEENGGSTSYETSLAYRAFSSPEGAPETVKILPEASSLDSILLSPSPGELDLDVYMYQHCIDKIKTNLHYVRGLSRLLHLIECRRKEFKLDVGLSSSSLWTRGSRKKVYEASLTKLDLTKNSLANDIRIMVSLEEDTKQLGSLDTSFPTGLGSVPLSLSLVYKVSGVEYRMILNVFRFEILENPNEHLSESWSSNSVFLMPVAIGLANLLNVAGKQEDKLGDDSLLEFSFKAILTGTEFASEGPYMDPIELTLAFNGPSRMLAREITTTDRSVSLVTDWLRHKSRTVFDARAELKYHIESTTKLEKLGVQSSPAGSKAAWSNCVSSALTNPEKDQLSKERDFFDIRKSVYLGMAMVRGVPCQVYERRLWKVPFWLGLKEVAPVPGFEIYLTLYQTTLELDVGKLLRLLVTVRAADRSLQSRYNLEIHSFHWSTNAIIADYQDSGERSLFDIGEDCLYSDDSLRHLKMDLQLTTSKFDTYLTTVRFEKEEKERERLISNALEEAFDVSGNQLVNLETTFSWDDNRNLTTIGAKLDLYELPKRGFVADFIAWAEDLGEKSFDGSGWLFGTNRVSLDECQWLASHVLHAKNFHVGDYDRKSEKDSQMFMFCPHTYHCVLGDSTWLPAVKAAGSFMINSVLKSSIGEDKKRCSIYSVRMIKVDVSGGIHLDTKGLTPFDWIARAKPVELIRVPISLKLDSDNIIPATTVRATTSGPIRTADRMMISQIHGLGYLRPTSRQPLRVSNPEKCGHLCFMEHNCQSYSICRELASFECLLTSVNLTDSGKVRELRALTTDSGGGETKKIAKLQLAESDANQVELELRVSPYCTLHTKSHSEAFQLREANKLIVVGKVESLLSAEVSEECAKFCIDRARLIGSLRQIAVQNGLVGLLASPEGCLSFEFNREFGFCSLEPKVEINKLLATRIDNGNISEHLGLSRLLESWRNASDRMQTRSANLPRFSEVDSYELNYEQLFVAHPGQRMMLMENFPAVELQRSLGRTPIQSCGRSCFLWAKCKSFDIYISPQAQQEPDLIECRLNAASYDDLAQDSEASQPFKLVELNLSSIEGNWWHYEPSELSLYLMGFELAGQPEGLTTTTAGGSSVFIERHPVRAGGIGAGLAPFPANNHEIDESLSADWSKAADLDRKRGGLGLWFMVSMVLVMLALVTVWLAARTTDGSSGSSHRYIAKRRRSIDTRQLLSS